MSAISSVEGLMPEISPSPPSETSEDPVKSDHVETTTEKLGTKPLTFLFFSIVFFCFFYSAMVFNSNETAENLKKSGAFIPGVRPGQNTASYVDGVMTRLTMAGAIYITIVCLLPEFSK